jgi:hypothetical protein
MQASKVVMVITSVNPEGYERLGKADTLKLGPLPGDLFLK